MNSETEKKVTLFSASQEQQWKHWSKMHLFLKYYKMKSDDHVKDEILKLCSWLRADVKEGIFVNCHPVWIQTLVGQIACPETLDRFFMYIITRKRLLCKFTMNVTEDQTMF